LKRTYGLTADQVEQMQREQESKCAICKETFVGSPHVDHDHVTGANRMLLCGDCNRGLGMFKDSPELLKTAASYLEQFSDTKFFAAIGERNEVSANAAQEQ